MASLVLSRAIVALAQSQSGDMQSNILPNQGQDVTESTNEAITVADVRFAKWGSKESYRIYDASWIIHKHWEPRVVFREYFSPVHERNEKELTFGVGYRFINRDKIVLVQDFLLSHARSRTGERTTFFQPTSRAFISIGHRLSLDLAGFPYVPVGHGNFQWVLERSRVACKVNSMLNVAGGWGATELPGVWRHGASWGVTFTPAHGKLGSFEFAYQGGIQFHYTLMVRHRKK